ncbi:hypothetical protein [Pseudomonas kurunegalensis]|uniref:hypothetical protein n=1 Tax=Pseudomonas kurunegalensis TaxID=485880 RepID=UPI004029361B
MPDVQNIFIIGVESTLSDLEWIRQCLATFDDAGEFTRDTFHFMLNNRYDGDMADETLMAYFDHGDSLPEGFKVNPDYNMQEH